MHLKPVHLILIGFLAGILTFAGCSSGLTLTKSFCDTEQSRIDAYYDMRAHGASFGQSFYAASDSILAASSTADKKILSPLYSTITSIRPGDSLDIRSASFYSHAKDILDAGFAIAKGVAK